MNIQHQILANTPNHQTIELYQPRNLSRDSVRPILFIGGVHGDEPEGVRLASMMQAWLASLPSEELDALHPWLLIPCLNPDGSQALTRTNAHGVDLNRNYPSSKWQSDYQEPRYYPGPEPASEIEVQTVVQLVKQYRPKLIIHFHSWHPCVVYTGASGLPVAQVLSDVSGYRLTEDIGYPTPGSLSDWAYHDLGTPVICLEESNQANLDSVWPRFKPAIINILTTAAFAL